MNLRRITLAATATILAASLAACQQSTDAPAADAAPPADTNVTINPPDVTVVAPATPPAEPSKSESSTVTVTVPDDPTMSGSVSSSTTTTEKK